MTPDKLIFDYFKNEKRFQNEIKTFFLVSQVFSFRHTKQTNRNVADTTFKAFLFSCDDWVWPEKLRGAFRTLPNVYVGAFFENGQLLKVRRDLT